MDEIVNKVANSVLEVFDLEDYYPSGIRTQLDISQWLLDGFLLKEKDFRAALLTTDWTIYKDKVVGIICSADAIIPMWANMLIVSALNDFAKSVYFGDETKVREQVLLENIASLSPEAYSEQRIVVKGCGDTPIGESAYIAITQKLRPVVKSIMYGEPCSTVPVYKKKA